MRNRTFLLLVFLVSLFACTPGVQPKKSKFDPEVIRAHVKFLSDDLLEGRFTGTRGYDLAAAYVASQYETYGLKPGGGDGAYYHQVPFRSATRVPGRQSLFIKSKGKETKLTELEDFVLRFPNRVHTKTSAAGAIVFVGFGISEPEIDYDDYANIDAKGKIVALFERAPSTFEPNQRAYFSSTNYKIQTAVEHGAVAVLLLRTPGEEKRVAWKRLASNPQRPAMSWLDKNGKPHPGWPEINGVLRLNRSGVDVLFQDSPVTFETAAEAAESGKPQSFDLNASARLSTQSTHAEFSSPNVIGILEGSDPKLKDEYIVYTGHLDHVGTGEPVDGDSIYNGAHDNSVGIAMMLEVARNFAESKTKPKRSLMFIALTGEERGLLGSDYFANYPTVPKEKIIANLNLDMFRLLFPVTEVVAFGAEHSSLGLVAEKAAKEIGFKLRPDPQPEETIFVRSDQYSIVRQGIPALYIDSSIDTDAPGFDGPTLSRNWRKNHYHKPSDEYDPNMHFDSGAKVAHFNYLLGVEIADAPGRPSWNEGDFFLEKFGQN